MIYLATSLFTIAERDFGFSLTAQIEKLGYTVYYPWRDAGDEELIEKFNGDMKRVNDEIVRRNLVAIRKCQQFIAVAEGADVESGTSMEIGFAHALGKKIRCLRTDFRTQGEKVGPVNIMISSPAEIIYTTVDELLDDLKKEYASNTPSVVSNIPLFYDEVANEYSDSKLHPTTALFKKTEEEYIKKILHPKTFRLAMDVGCGDGNFLLNVQAENKIGLDASVEMIKRHKEKLQTAQYILGDCTSLLVQDSCVDLLHASFLLDHLSEKDRLEFFNEANRVLSDEGLFILSTYAPQDILQQRDNTNSFVFESTTGKRFMVPSDFSSLKNLKSQLQENFRLDSHTNLPIENEGLSVDCYLMRKK